MVQHRKTLTVNFTRGWKDYKNGFGTNAEFWLGNEIVHLLTSRHHNQLYIGIIDTNGSYLYQKYHFIRVGPESDKYRLHIEGPTTGDAGDFILRYNNSKSINNQRFTTFDNDNDNNAGNCATGTGGWWYNSCHYVALNNDPDSPETVYQDRVPNMSHFRFSSMMINRAP
ncbi:ficolin-2-like [Saccostrea cucullata]|uniref:ficolin-2-like n=1 Tax=Saccostrea cuccullata TaxID=36930 RepID=UPI002ED0E561